MLSKFSPYLLSWCLPLKHVIFSHLKDTCPCLVFPSSLVSPVTHLLSTFYTLTHPSEFTKVLIFFRALYFAFQLLLTITFSLQTFSVQSFQSLSRVQLFVTSWTSARQASLSSTNSWRPPKGRSIESVVPSNSLILRCPLLLLPSILPIIRVFSNESALRIRWPKYWSFSFNISPSNEHPELISFRMDWLDLLAVQGTPKSLLQHHSSKASILRHSAFLIVQLSLWLVGKP